MDGFLSARCWLRSAPRLLFPRRAFRRMLAFTWLLSAVVFAQTSQNPKPAKPPAGASAAQTSYLKCSGKGWRTEGKKPAIERVQQILIIIDLKAGDMSWREGDDATQTTARLQASDTKFEGRVTMPDFWMPDVGREGYRENGFKSLTVDRISGRYEYWMQAFSFVDSYAGQCEKAAAPRTKF